MFEEKASETRKRPLINFIKWFKNRFFPTKYNKYIARETRKKMKSFNRLESIGANAKKRIFPALLHSQVLLSSVKDIKRNHFSPFFFLLAIPVIILLLGMPFFVSLFFNFSFDPNTWLIANVALYFLYLIGLMLFMVLLLIFLEAKSAVMQYSGLILSCIIPILILVWFYWTKDEGQIGVLAVVIISILSFWLFYIAYILIVLMPFELLIRFIASYKLRYYPETVIAGSLLNILTRLEFSPKSWTEMEYKQEICRELETIALELQKFANRMKARDAETNVWFREHIAGVAQSFRSKKKTILTPTPRSRQELIEVIAQSLVNVAQGNWGSLKTETPLSFKEGSRLWISKIPRLFRSVFVSAIPLIALYLLQLTPLKFEEPYFSYAKIGAIGWFTISFIIMLDPLYNSKLTALKDIKSLLSLGGKDK